MNWMNKKEVWYNSDVVFEENHSHIMLLKFLYGWFSPYNNTPFRKTRKLF